MTTDKIRQLQLGLCMDGCEWAMEGVCRTIIRRFDAPCYLEIGVAQGQTICSIATILNGNSNNWVAVGLDLPDGYSLILPNIQTNATERGIGLHVIRDFPQGAAPAFASQSVSICLKNSHDFLAENWRLPVHFGLIDGCHGKSCVMKDFNLLSTFVPVGGFIAFHDFGQDSVGEPQVHCKTGDTLGACLELGIMNGTCPSWRYCGTVIGDKPRIGRDLGIFERVASA